GEGVCDEAGSDAGCMVQATSPTAARAVTQIRATVLIENLLYVTLLRIRLYLSREFAPPVQAISPPVIQPASLIASTGTRQHKYPRPTQVPWLLPQPRRRLSQETCRCLPCLFRREREPCRPV